jgi:hypothetical protein
LGQDFLTADDFLGQVEIPLFSVPMRMFNEKPVDPQWYKLERRTLKDPVKGEARSKVSYFPPRMRLVYGCRGLPIKSSAEYVICSCSTLCHQTIFISGH